MKRKILLGCLLVAVLGCGKQHPVKVFIDDTMKDGTVEKVAVFSFASRVHHSDDPDDLASRTMDDVFRAELDRRNDYQFSSPSSIAYALQSAGLENEAEAFMRDWTESKKANVDFLAKLSGILQVDAVLLGVVDLWQKDEVDYRENAAAATYVGATVSMLSVKDGRILFEASDEDYLETTRSEKRAVSTSTLGAVRRDPQGTSYRAPEPREVALKVARALVASIPIR